MSGNVRLEYPGLTKERNTSGTIRWRVRPKGERGRKITIPIGPDHTDFQKHYEAARRGIKLDAPAPIEEERGTMGWLFTAYLQHLELQVESGAASPLTLKERKSLSAFVLSQTSEQERSKGRGYRSLPMNIPTAELEALKDRMAGTPGKARNVWKFLTAAYDFGTRRGLCSTNPPRAVPRPAYKSAGGAKPWTVDDLLAFRKAHPKGTTAHLALTLFMFTACRIGDPVLLGREHETRRNGTPWLVWQPSKRGSKMVEIPILAPLQSALDDRKVIGSTYLLTAHGKPFKSPAGLRNKMQEWCEAAGLEGLSSHGIRKAAGHLLALNGASQYEIMSVHGHANAATSQVYTDAVERARLGQLAVSKLAGLDW